MLQFRGRRRQTLPVNAEINITNLVDVAFVLLIIFMITAPILQGGIELSLPEADAAPLDASDAMIVSIAGDGTIFVEKVPVKSLEEFRTVFTAYATAGGKRRQVMVKADRSVSYGRFTQVLGAMEQLDVADVGLAVEPLPGR